MHNDLARLFDGEELVLRGMHSTERRRRDALLAQVVVGAVEALVTHTNDLHTTYVANDVPVDGRSVYRRLGGTTRVVGRLDPVLAVILADPEELRVVHCCVHREEAVRDIVALALD